MQLGAPVSELREKTARKKSSDRRHCFYEDQKRTTDERVDGNARTTIQRLPNATSPVVHRSFNARSTPFRGA